MVAQTVNALVRNGGSGGGAGPAGPAGPTGATGPTGPAGAAAFVAKGEATATLTGVGGVIEWTETVTATGVTSGNAVLLSLAPGTDADENDPEMLDVLAMSARPLTGQIEITANFATPTSGPVKFNWSAF